MSFEHDESAVRALFTNAFQCKGFEAYAIGGLLMSGIGTVFLLGAISSIRLVPFLADKFKEAARTAKGKVCSKREWTTRGGKNKNTSHHYALTIQYGVREDGSTVTKEVRCTNSCFSSHFEGSDVQVLYLPPPQHDPRVAILEVGDVNGKPMVVQLFIIAFMTIWTFTCIVFLGNICAYLPVFAVSCFVVGRRVAAAYADPLGQLGAPTGQVTEAGEQPPGTTTPVTFHPSHANMFNAPATGLLQRCNSFGPIVSQAPPAGGGALRFCPQCGGQRTGDAPFCGQCGHEF